MEAMTVGNGERVSGEELRESEIQRAERIVREELAKLGWTMRDLKAARKGDRRKLKIARRLRTETAMTWSWISQRLPESGGIWPMAFAKPQYENDTMFGNDPFN